MSVDIDALRLLVENMNAGQREAKAEIMDGIRGIHLRLDDLNGRTRKNTEEIAVINARKDERDRRVNELKAAVDALASTPDSEADDEDDDPKDEVSLRMSKTMFLAAVSAIAAVWAVVAPYLSRLLNPGQ